MPEGRLGVAHPLRRGAAKIKTYGMINGFAPPWPFGRAARSLVLGTLVAGGAPLAARADEGAPEGLAAAAPAAHWAYQPVRPPAPPALSGSAAARVQQPLDAFVLGALETRGFSLSPRAGRDTLIRRAYFDLIGVPPTVEEVAAFVSDPADDGRAMAALVDRLLSDSRFGERWGRYWLDVARYADSKGYVFQEERRYAYSYTYRDWVVGAFNEDLPYDKFVLAQLAADQSLGQEDPRHLAAMGFLTLGRRFLNNQHDIIDDRLDVTFRGLQATTISCARCHDHKFDPIPIADYYSLYGVFASSEEPQDKPLLGEPERTPEYLAFEAELQKREQAVVDFHHQKKEALFSEEAITKYLQLCAEGWTRDDDGLRALARERQLYASVAVRWREHLRALGAEHPVVAPFLALVTLLPEQFADRRDDTLRPLLEAARVHPKVAESLRTAVPASMAEAAGLYAKLLAPYKVQEPMPDPEAEAMRLVLMAPAGPGGVDPMSLGRDFSVAERDVARNLRNEVDSYKATAENGPPRAMSMQDKGEPVRPVVFKRGSPGNRGEEVPRQFLGALAGPGRKPFAQGSGRLELAQTIASPSNPLTARVYANRVWLWLTGQSLVESPSDFGVRTPPPVNPALLDHLAASLVEGGWSTKRLIREIVLSAAWQQSSTWEPAVPAAPAPPDAAPAPSRPPSPLAADPENTLLWKMNRRRRDFESFRDSLLTVSGRLDAKVGGRPVSLDSAKANRRTIYGFIDRQNLPGLFRSFDFASPDQHAPKRFQTTVPQQALFALNNPFVLVQARALAGLPAESETAKAAAILRRVLSRDPEPSEVARAAEFITTGPASQTAGAWEYGTGDVDPATGAARFHPFAHHQGDRWTCASEWPEGACGHAVIQAEGGHPGPDQARGVVWRWLSPETGKLDLSGEIKRPSDQGDGVRLRLVTGTRGVVRTWEVPPGAGVTLDGTSIEVAADETLDFIVDAGQSDTSDSIEVSFRLKNAAGHLLASSRDEFSGPALDPWVAYAQVLLISNEFMFVD